MAIETSTRRGVGVWREANDRSGPILPFPKAVTRLRLSTRSGRFDVFGSRNSILIRNARLHALIHEALAVFM
jgi:hypothetical protein